MTAVADTGKAITVVICDDHQVFVDGLVALLASEPDIDVVGVAGLVAEVMEMVDRYRPDVVLLDYELPDGNGVAAARAIKAAHPAIMVVMLTSYTDETILVEAIEAGCSGYITKHKGSQVVASGIRLAAQGEALVPPDLLRRLLPKLSPTNLRLGSDLTPREIEVLELLAVGATNPMIADRLFLSPNTVRNHCQSILTKLGAHSRLEAVSIAVREGIIKRT